MYQAPRACRSCSHQELTQILTLGKRPTTVGRASSDVLLFCPRCALVQHSEIPSRPAFIGDMGYPARPERAAWLASQLAGQIIATQKLRPTSLVIEIGSGDGQLLHPYQAAGIPVLGIEPAIQGAELARLDHGVPTLCKHFGRYLAEQLAGCDQYADVLHVRGVIAQVVDINSFTLGLAGLLKPRGVAVLEVPHVKGICDRGELPAILARHISYFSVTSLARLLARHGLLVHDAELSNSPDSLRLFVGKQGGTSQRVAKMLSEEAAWGVDSASSYLRLAEHVAHLPRAA